MLQPTAHGLRPRPAAHRGELWEGSSRLPVWRGPSRVHPAPCIDGISARTAGLTLSPGPLRSLSVMTTTADDTAFPGFDARPLPAFVPRRRAVKLDRLSRLTPKPMKGFVEFRHNAFHERAVADPILDEDHKRCVGKADSVLGLEFVQRTGRAALACVVRAARRSRRAFNRLDEHLAHPIA